MDPSMILFIVDQLVFWVFIATIAWKGRTAPPWVYKAFSVYIIYYIFRLAFGLQGWQRFSAVYVLGLAAVFMIWYYFV